MITLDPVLLARIQFAFTVSFHIIFPAFTIGLASFLAVLEGLWLKTQNTVYKDIYKFWIKVFAVTFGMGVVSGVVMSYSFGTNWSVFSEKVSNVIGPLLGYEVLTAFFLESSFLGIMLFGWDKVSPRMHFVSTCVVAGGTLLSAFWILSANSWMQTPQGFEIKADGVFYPTSWMEIIFNPSFHHRLMHMVSAAYLTTSFVVGGVGAIYLLQRRFVEHAKVMLGMATMMAAILGPIQAFIGDAHALNTLQYQPAKIAAIESIWHTGKAVPWTIVGFPDEELAETKYAVDIPYGSSLILTHSLDGEVKGLNEWPREDWPHVAIVFWSFRVMVGLGVLMICLGFLSAFQYFRGKLFTSDFVHKLWVCMMPSGFCALLAGWFVTEVGRQPYVVYGILRTVDAATPALLGGQIAWSLMLFVITYSLVFGAGMYYIVKICSAGIVETGEK